MPAVCLMSGLKNASLTARGCDLQCAAVFFHGLEKVAEAKTRLLSLAYADTLLYSLYNTVVLYTILYYTILYGTILYFTLLHCALLYYTMLCCRTIRDCLNRFSIRLASPRRSRKKYAIPFLLCPIYSFGDHP